MTRKAPLASNSTQIADFITADQKRLLTLWEANSTSEADARALLGLSVAELTL